MVLQELELVTFLKKIRFFIEQEDLLLQNLHSLHVDSLKISPYNCYPKWSL